MTHETDDDLIKLARTRIAEARERSGMKQATVSTSVGISPPQYSRLESGQGEMSLRQFLGACRAVGIKPWVALDPNPGSGKAQLAIYENALTSLQSQIEAAKKKDAWE